MNEIAIILKRLHALADFGFAQIGATWGCAF
jgi:hypothetical protein